MCGICSIWFSTTEEEHGGGPFFPPTRDRMKRQRQQRKCGDVASVLGVCVAEAVEQQLTELFFFGSALYSPHAKDVDLIAAGLPANPSTRTMLGEAMCSKTGWSIDVHCVDSYSSPWLRRLDDDGVGVWLIRNGRVTRKATSIFEGRSKPTFEGRFGPRHFVRFLVSELKVFTRFLHVAMRNKEAVWFSDLYDAAHRLWKLFLDFKDIEYDPERRQGVIYKLSGALAMDLPQLSRMVEQCQTQLNQELTNNYTKEAFPLQLVGPTVYQIVREYVSFLPVHAYVALISSPGL
jgi:hypothetical protein